jgi:hypothetical protein
MATLTFCLFHLSAQRMKMSFKLTSLYQLLALKMEVLTHLNGFRKNVVLDLDTAESLSLSPKTT